MGGGSEQAWLGVFDQLVASERLCTLKLVVPDLWQRDIVLTEVTDISGVSGIVTGASTRRWSHMFGSRRCITFTNRSVLLEGLARFIGSELGRGTSCVVIDIVTDLDDAL